LKDVTIIVVNWNGREWLEDCFDSLVSQDYQQIKLILVDNGSEDGSVQLIRARYPETAIIELDRNYGFAQANNFALKAADSEYIALLNNDMIARSDWLTALVRAIERYPEAGSAASKLLYHSRPGIIDRAGDVYTRAGAGHLRGRGHAAGCFDRLEWIFGACGGASIYRRRMLDDIGGFDPDFFLIYEDVDLSFRAQLRGYKCLYVPDAIAYHRVSRSIGYDSPVSVYYGHRNMEWVYIKNMPSALMMKTFYMHLLYILMSFSYFSLRGLARPYIRSKKDAMRAAGKMLGKRRGIQAAKTVNDDYIWQIMAAERFLPRLFKRFRGRRSTGFETGVDFRSRN
jgi:hypothetical protein